MNRSTSPDAARGSFSGNRAVLASRIISYRQTATACPRFIEIFCSQVGMRTSQWQWLRSLLDSPNFSEPKSSATRFVPIRLRIRRAPSSRRLQRVMQLPVAHRRRPNHQRAIGHGFGHALKLLGLFQDIGRAHRGTRFAKRLFVRIHCPQMTKAKIAHGTRGCANIQRIAHGYQHDPHSVELRRSKQARSF